MCKAPEVVHEGGCCICGHVDWLPVNRSKRWHLNIVEYVPLPHVEMNPIPIRLTCNATNRMIDSLVLINHLLLGLRMRANSHNEVCVTLRPLRL